MRSPGRNWLHKAQQSRSGHVERLGSETAHRCRARQLSKCDSEDLVAARVSYSGNDAKKRKGYGLRVENFRGRGCGVRFGNGLLSLAGSKWRIFLRPRSLTPAS